jgi:hypothetical protein
MRPSSARSSIVLRAYLNLCEFALSAYSLVVAGVDARSHAYAVHLGKRATVQERGKATLALGASPRVVGYYEDANAPGDPYVSMAYATLIDPVVRLASGDFARWETESGGELFLQAIAVRKRAQVREAIHPPDLFYPPTFPPRALAQTINGQAISLREEYASVLRAALCCR